MAPIQVQTPNPPRYEVRPLGSGDFRHLQRLEREIWSGDAAGMLCPHYLRLCTDLYSEWCFIALDGDRPVGYVLNFPNGKVNYCATLAVHPDYQKTRVNYLLIRAMVKKLLPRTWTSAGSWWSPTTRTPAACTSPWAPGWWPRREDFYCPATGASGR